MHLNDVERQIRELERKGLLREPDDSLIRTQLQLTKQNFIDAASNDYLGLAQKTAVTVPNEAEAKAGVPVGSGASRLIFGTHEIHRVIEKTCAEWLGYEESMLFSSGFAANCGVLPALISSGDAVFSDQLNHASLIDALRLAPVKAQVFQHLNLEQLEQQLIAAQASSARWVVVESYYSMDGDGPDLVKLSKLCRKFDAHLFVDEAHSLGVFGHQGAGLCKAVGVKPDILMCGLGKAVGSAGAIVACSQLVRCFLWNRARSFVYSTAPSPRASRDLLKQIQQTQAADDLREQLEARCLQIRVGLNRALREVQGTRVRLAEGFGPIVSLVLGSEQLALALALDCRAEGLLVQAIRPPTVPEGQSRLRITVKADWTERQVESVISILIQSLSPFR